MFEQDTDKKSSPQQAEAAGTIASEGAATRLEGEQETIEQAKAGSVEAREHLARELGPHVYRLAFQLTGNREDAADLSQDVLIKFLTTLDRFDETKPVLPWVRRITRNASIDRFRRKKVRKTDSLDTDGYEGESIDILSSAPSPEATYQERQFQRQIWSCLHELKDTHREILVLRDYQDLAYSEIAEVLEIPIGTVMSRLHAARKRLRDALLREGVWSE